MSKPQASVTKRQREQAKRDRQRLKAEKRAQRKSGEGGVQDDDEMMETVVETPVESDITS